MKHTGVISHDQFSFVIAYAPRLKVHFQLHGLPHVKNPVRWLYGERPARHVEAPSEHISDYWDEERRHGLQIFRQLTSSYLVQMCSMMISPLMAKKLF